MSKKQKVQCPGCSAQVFRGLCRVPRQPVVLNYRYPTAETARKVKRRDLFLRQCADCGLIFNSTFDPGAIPYDENYDNRQCFSPAFECYLTGLAEEFIERHSLHGQPVLEVGCGKGDFLKLFCRLSGGPGTGYDTTYQGPSGLQRNRIRFHRRYVSASDIRSPYAAALCRHVVEHIGTIGAFLSDLRKIAAACGDPIILIETPRFEWIAEHLCFWDIFYEHCNYFTMPCLATLCRRAGFNVIRQRATFGRQYQVLELKLDRGTARARKTKTLVPSVSLNRFARQAEMQLRRLEKKLTANGAGAGWAVWGAGAKGVALVNRLKRNRPRFVIDSNRGKQGGVIPGSSVPVVAPEDPRLLRLGVILIANPNYAAEIKSVLKRTGFAGKILIL